MLVIALQCLVLPLLGPLSPSPIPGAPAAGRTLAASSGQIRARPRLDVDARGARHSSTVDPLVQQAYLKASNTDWGDMFGTAVAISGDTAVVGAWREQSNATGVNGDQSDNSLDFAGAAYVFVRSGKTWSQEAYLKASNTDAADEFGSSVSVSGNTIVVGAPGEASLATGIDGNQSDNSAQHSGAAYVFVRSGTAWSQQAYLKPSNTDLGDFFGRAVSVSGDTVVVGANGEDSWATGVDGNQSIDTAENAGAAYVFVRDGTTWSQEAYLKASNTGRKDFFGHCVSVSGDTAVVGALYEDSWATGVDGDQSDNSYKGAGAAYVFARSGSTWSQEAYLKASNTDPADYFGIAVALSGNTAIIGAPYEASGATGIDGDQGDNGTTYAGAAYVFVRSGTSWNQQAYVKASNTGSGDFFGIGVALSGDTAVVGAHMEASGATGVNGDEGDDSMPAAGAAYVLRRSGTTWSQESYLKASNTEADEQYGWAVSVADDLVVVGARREDGGTTGVNGDESDNSAPFAGAAYVYSLPEPGTGYCFGDLGSGSPCPCANDNDGSVRGSGCANGVFASGAQLSGQGLASVSADTLVLFATGLEPGNSGLYFQADNDLSPGSIWGDGLRCAGGNLKRLQVRFADAAGASSTTIGISGKAGNVQPGDTKYYQCWYRTNVDPPCGAGVNDFNTSNGYAVTWAP